MGAFVVVRAFSKLPRGPCGLSSGAGGRWGSPMARGPWGSLSLVFAALSVCGALGGSCDRSLCSSVADDCCAPLSIGEAATCRNGYVAQRTGNGCFGYGEGDYTCCPTSASSDDSGGSNCVREYENDRTCGSHFFGEHYQDLDAALAACAANSGCSGVYDNRCDGQTIQYDSRTTGFVMCDSDYDFERSYQGSCIVTCEAPAPTPVPSSLPTAAPTPEPSPAPSLAPTHTPTHTPTEDIWGGCDWVRSNSNAAGERQIASNAASPDSCIAMVKEQCPDATIANMPVDGDGGCWCQYGYNPTPDNGGYMSCVLATAGTPAPQPALVRQRARRLSRRGVCQGTGCHYDFGYQWSTTECEPGDANYPEGCEAGGGGGGGKKTGGGGGGKKTGLGGAAGTITMLAAWLGIGLCCCLAAVLAVRCRRRAAKREDGTVAPAPPAVLEMSNVKGQGAPIMHAQTVPPVTAPPQIVMPQLGPPMLVQPQILGSGVPVPAHLPVAELMPAAYGFCAKCRAPLAAGAAFCGRCGQAV